MIVLDSYNKIDILYRNYVKQFSSAYIKGSNLYVGGGEARPSGSSPPTNR